MLQTRL